MSDSIYWILEVAIHPGKLTDFKAVARDLIAATQSEAGTLGYEWHLSADETVCHIYERYANSDVVLVHVQSFGNFAPRFIEACRPTRFDIYGKPSAAVKEALADFNPAYFSALGAISR
jgi:quinol monooxygenase YgiN